MSSKAAAHSSPSKVSRPCAGTRLVEASGSRWVDAQTFIVQAEDIRVATLLSGNHIQNER